VSVRYVKCQMRANLLVLLLAFSIECKRSASTDSDSSVSESSSSSNSDSSTSSSEEEDKGGARASSSSSSSSSSLEEEIIGKKSHILIEQEEASKDPMRRSGALIARDYLKEHDLEKLVDFITEITHISVTSLNFEKGLLHNVGLRLRHDMADLVDLMGLIIKKQAPARALSQVLEVSNSKMAFPSLVDKIIGVIGTINDLRYFAQVTKALGDYYGWMIVYFHISGTNLPSKFSDEQLVITRVLAAINIGDAKEIADVVELAQSQTVNHKKLLDAITIAVKEAMDILPQVPAMFRMIKTFLGADQVRENFQAPIRAELALQYTNNMAVRRKSGMRQALAQLEEFGDTNVKNMVLGHFRDRNIAVPSTINGIICGMIHDDLSVGTLENYLRTVKRGIVSIVDLPEPISKKLSAIEDAQKLVKYLEVIRDYGKMSASQMLKKANDSPMEKCNRDIVRIYYSIMTDSKAEVEKALREARDDVKACSVKNLLEGIEYSLDTVKAGSRSRMSKIVGDSKILTEKKLALHLLKHRSQFHRLCDIKLPKKVTKKAKASSGAKKRILWRRPSHRDRRQKSIF